MFLLEDYIYNLTTKTTISKLDTVPLHNVSTVYNAPANKILLAQAASVAISVSTTNINDNLVVVYNKNFKNL